MRTLVALILFTALLAGCSANSSDKQTPDGPGPITVTDDTGGIRGVVVDQTITPLAGAHVVLHSGEELTTAADGGFVFDGLEPGDYFIRATKPGYESAQQATTVVAGDATPQPVNILLAKIPGAEPYRELYKLEGFYECGFALFFITDGCDFGYRTAWDEYNATTGSPPPGGLPRTIQQFSNTQYITIGEKAQSIVQEAFWDDPSVTTFWEMVSSTPIDNACDCSETDYLSAEGENPIHGRIDRFADDGTENGGFPANKLVAARGFLPFQELTGASTAVNFEFVIITNVFYSYQPAEGWNFEENGGEEDPV